MKPMEERVELREVLQQVLAIKGVTSAAVVSHEGLVVESVSDGKVDLAFVSGLIASSLASSQVLAGLMGEGELQQAMIEYDKGPILMTPLQRADEAASEYVVVVTLSSTAFLGRVRFQLRKLLPKVSEAVLV
jgi:predicted regulator of Ras-like GTPase activity (Roadblock/LC7/MglB family)